MNQECSFKDALITLEKDGSLFYRRMSKNVQDPRLKDLLNYLAEEEDYHAREIETHGALLCSEDFPEEKIAKMKDNMSYIFDKSVDLDILERKLDSEEAILYYALGIEKKSIDLYTELNYQVSDNPDLMKLVQPLLKAEQEHYNNISVILRIQQHADEDPMKSLDEFEHKLREAINEDEKRKN